MEKKEILDMYLSDAPHYLHGARVAVNNMKSQSAEFRNNLNSAIGNVRSKGFYDLINFTGLVNITSQLTLKNVKSEGCRWNDLDSVGWEMGKLCLIYTESLPIANNKFDDLFLASWEKYFSDNIDV